MVANLCPAAARAKLARGTLDALALEAVPVAVGSEANRSGIEDNFTASARATGFDYLVREAEEAEEAEEAGEAEEAAEEAAEVEEAEEAEAAEAVEAAEAEVVDGVAGIEEAEEAWEAEEAVDAPCSEAAPWSSSLLNLGVAAHPRLIRLGSSFS